MDAFCVHCDCRIDLGIGVTEGGRVTCPACRACLEVINTSPIELDWAYDQPYLDDRHSYVRADQQDT